MQSCVIVDGVCSSSLVAEEKGLYVSLNGLIANNLLWKSSVFFSVICPLIFIIKLNELIYS